MWETITRCDQLEGQGTRVNQAPPIGSDLKLVFFIACRRSCLAFSWTPARKKIKFFLACMETKSGRGYNPAAEGCLRRRYLSLPVHPSLNTSCATLESGPVIPLTSQLARLQWKRPPQQRSTKQMKTSREFALMLMGVFVWVLVLQILHYGLHILTAKVSFAR